MRRLMLLTTALLILPGCGLLDAFTSGAREPVEPEPVVEQTEAARPPLVAAPGGVSQGVEHNLFIRPTATASEGTLEGSAYKLEAIEARPAGGNTR